MSRLFLLMLFSTPLFAQLVMVERGDLFVGKEVYNHGETGKQCSVEILSVESHASKGIHCNKIKLRFKFPTKLKNQPEGLATIFSARSFWRDGVISCASLVDSDDDQDRAFEPDTEKLFNEMFSGQAGNVWSRSSYFLSFNSDKMPSEALMSNVKPTIERTWSCVELKLLDL